MRSSGRAGPAWPFGQCGGPRLRPEDPRTTRVPFRTGGRVCVGLADRNAGWQLTQRPDVAVVTWRGRLEIVIVVIAAGYGFQQSTVDARDPSVVTRPLGKLVSCPRFELVPAYA